jgi:hypothetical protein
MFDRAATSSGGPRISLDRQRFDSDVLEHVERFRTTGQSAQGCSCMGTARDIVS